MKRKNALLTGFLFTVLFGSLWHFVYEWSGGNPVLGAFAPVNESVWEHLKLLAMPMLLFAVYEYLTYARHIANFWPVRLLSVFVGMALIILLYYVCDALFGKPGMGTDIAIFIFSDWAAYFFGAGLLDSSRFSSGRARTLALVGIFALLAVFAVLSYVPPHGELFRDPPTGGFGPVFK